MSEGPSASSWAEIIRTTLRNRHSVPYTEWDSIVDSCGEKVGDVKHAEQVITAAEDAWRLSVGATE